jgi:hypothetical protein
MWAGVSKSGSPTPNPMTGFPAALSAAALAATASVALSFRRPMCEETCTAGRYTRVCAAVRYTRGMHFDAHQPVIDELEARISAIRDSL